MTNTIIEWIKANRKIIVITTFQFFGIGLGVYAIICLCLRPDEHQFKNQRLPGGITHSAERFVKETPVLRTHQLNGKLTVLGQTKRLDGLYEIKIQDGNPLPDGRRWLRGAISNQEFRIGEEVDGYFVEIINATPIGTPPEPIQKFWWVTPKKK
ncbi:MAG: hypothetical protein WCF94_03150 [bacterium]